jgi:hypothetical protein
VDTNYLHTLAWSRAFQDSGEFGGHERPSPLGDAIAVIAPSTMLKGGLLGACAYEIFE